MLRGMAKLSTADRKSLLSRTFGLPGKRAYPLNDKPHARNALARASQEFNAGNLTASQKAQIDAKAHKVLRG